MDVEFADNSQKVKDELEQAVLRALEICGGKAEGYAKKLCPVDTGRLRNSITHTVDGGKPAAYVGTNVEYATYVEMGTSTTKAQPYLKPAVTDHASEYRWIIDNELKKG